MSPKDKLSQYDPALLSISRPSKMFALRNCFSTLCWSITLGASTSFGRIQTICLIFVSLSLDIKPSNSVLKALRNSFSCVRPARIFAARSVKPSEIILFVQLRPILSKSSDNLFLLLAIKFVPSYSTIPTLCLMLNLVDAIRADRFTRPASSTKAGEFLWMFFILKTNPESLPLFLLDSSVNTVMRPCPLSNKSRISELLGVLKVCLPSIIPSALY
mmetsp:Transcript_21364/g.31912  ORF Transcript_21364/g.31912 Transcript_21364/m.31912 type:complete len:216 (+) Transcript_21364:1877-2524(+)